MQPYPLQRAAKRAAWWLEVKRREVKLTAMFLVAYARAEWRRRRPHRGSEDDSRDGRPVVVATKDEPVRYEVKSDTATKVHPGWLS